MITITAFFSTALYITDKGKLTALYKTNNDVYIKTSKIINYSVIILYSSHIPPPPPPHTHTHIHTGAQKECNRGEARMTPI